VNVRVTTSSTFASVVVVLLDAIATPLNVGAELSYSQTKSDAAVLLLPTASVKAPPAIAKVYVSFDAGVNTIVYSGELPVAVKEPNEPVPEPALVYVKSAAVRPVGVSLTSILNVIDEAAVVDPEAP